MEISSATDVALRSFWTHSSQYYEFARESNEPLVALKQRLFSHIRQSARVLDVGAGTCENVKLLKDRGVQYVGVDVGLAGLELARDHNAVRGTGALGDGGRLPFADGTFDAVISTNALEHFVDPEGVLREMNRVTKPGGLVVLIAPAWDNPFHYVISLKGQARRRYALYPQRLLDAGLELLASAVGRDRWRPIMIDRPDVIVDGSYEADADVVYLARVSEVRRFFTRRLGYLLVDEDRGTAPMGLAALWPTHLALALEKPS